MAFKAVNGQTYRIRVQSGGDPGTLKFHALVATSPAEDDRAKARVITSLPFQRTVSTLGATRQGSEPEPPCFDQWEPASTVWYRFAPAQDTTLRVNALASDPQVVIGVYRLSGGVPLPEGCNPSGNIAVSLLGGRSYLIQAGGVFGYSGNLRLAFSKVTPPANDAKAHAKVVGALPFDASLGTRNATMTAGEADSACDAGTGQTVWYSITPGTDKALRAYSSGSGFDANIAVFRKNGGSLVPVACNYQKSEVDDHASVAFRAVAGTTYLLQVGGRDGASGVLKFHLDKVTPPPNDTFAAADEFTSVTTKTGDTTNAVGDAGEPTPSCSPFSHNGVWYRVDGDLRPGVGQTIVVRVYNSGFDALAAIYTGPSLGSLTEISCESSQTYIIDPQAGVTYWIQVLGFDGQSGALEVELL